MELKMRLGREIVALYHGEAAAKDAEEAFVRTFRDGKEPEEMEVFQGKGRIWIVDLLRDSGLAASGNAARSLIGSGAVSIDGEKITDAGAEIDPASWKPEGSVLRVGRRGFRRLEPPSAGV
jgi:tyrosyl-tRNA synthetase